MILSIFFSYTLEEVLSKVGGKSGQQGLLKPPASFDVTVRIKSPLDAPFLAYRRGMLAERYFLEVIFFCLFVFFGVSMT